MSRLIASLALAWMLAGSAGNPALAAPHPTQCNTAILKMKEVQYWSGPKSAPAGQWRCTGTHCSESGWLYYPNRKDLYNLPAIVFNPGSGQQKGERSFCAIAEFFTQQGYAVFVPLRRGYEATNGDFASTGLYFSDYQDTCAANLQCLVPDGSGGCAKCESGLCAAACTDDARQLKLVEDLQSETAEVQAAFTYLKNTPSIRPPGTKPDPTKAYLVNPNLIAVMGHSFGGIVSLFNNALDGRPTAVVDISGDALSWGGNPALDTGLENAVLTAKKPLFCFQPRNEIHIEPTQHFSQVALDSGQRTQAALFPPSIPKHADGTPCTSQEIAEQATDCTADDVHINFVIDPSQVAHWGPAALAFLRLYGGS